MLVRGQALIEFLVVAAALVTALVLPVVNGRSAAGLLLAAILDHLRAQAYLISIL
jgi:hypothetical protein